MSIVLVLCESEQRLYVPDADKLRALRALLKSSKPAAKKPTKRRRKKAAK